MSDTVGVEVLWRRCKEGDRAARDELVLMYEPLVQHAASKMACGLPRSVEHSDLVSYGVFGLLDAIAKFDPGRGFRFETYAVSRVKGAILDELRSIDWVPRSVRAKARAVDAAHSRLEGELHREPVAGEMAAALDVTIEQYETTLGLLSQTGPIALDEIWEANGERSETVVAPEPIDEEEDRHAEFEMQELRRLLTSTADGMSERDTVVFALYYLQGLTLAEIGQVLGVTESRVCQIHTKVVMQFHARLTAA